MVKLKSYAQHPSFRHSWVYFFPRSTGSSVGKKAFAQTKQRERGEHYKNHGKIKNLWATPKFPTQLDLFLSSFEWFESWQGNDGKDRNVC